MSATRSFSHGKYPRAWVTLEQRRQSSYAADYCFYAPAK
jgi:hypothetical protein